MRQSKLEKRQGDAGPRDYSAKNKKKTEVKYEVKYLLYYIIDYEKEVLLYQYQHKLWNDCEY